MKIMYKWSVIVVIGALCASCQWKVAEKEKEEETELESDGMEQAMRQEFLMTHDPETNTVPTERLQTARSMADGLQMRANGSFSTNRVAALTWQERGPNNIGGRTRAILVDRRDASGNTVLAASVSGGIFRTTDFLTSPPDWSPVADNMVNLAVTCMVQDKANGSVMYAGTGEGWFNVDAVKGAGVFKSIDGGLTWNQLASTTTFEYVQDIEMDNSGNLYASLRNLNSTSRGVLRSADGGATWTQVLGAPLAGFATGRAADLEVASNGDVYATLGIFSKTMVMKSAANGVNTGALGTWIDITPVHSAATERAEIAIAPSNPQRLYLAMVDSASSKVNYLYRSFNAGITWDSLPAPDAIINNGTVSQNWYNLILGVSPTNPDFVTLGGFHVARSSDAGANWTNITASSNVHVDQHMIMFIGSSSKMIVGNDGGIWYSSNADATTPGFSNKNTGYNVTQFYGVDVHPTQTNYFLAGAQDNNTQKFTTASVNATTPVVGGDGGFPHIRQTDGVLQIASTTNNNYYRSQNSGTSFSYLSTVSNNRGQFINATDLDNSQNVLYCGDDAGKYYYITGLDATPSGSQVTVSAIGSNRIVTAVKVDPTAVNTVWMGTSSSGTSVLPVVVKLSNANTSSPTVQSFTLPSVTGASVSSIDVDASNSNHLLVTLSNYGVISVFETTNGGTTWNNVEGNLPDMPVRWALIIPSNASVDGTTAGGVLLATELGVWYTGQTNGTSTNWTPVNNGLPNVRTDMLRYRASDNLVVAATHGRGLFSTNLTSITTGIPTVANTRNFIDYISANAQQVFVKVGNLTTTTIDIRIFDMNGRLVYSGKTAYSNQTIAVLQLSGGSYIIKIYGNKNEQYTKQFIK